MVIPRIVRNRLQRHADCRDAMRAAVNYLIERALAAGWTHNEVSTALINLAGELFPDLNESGEWAHRPAALRH
jgi:hypothetical protein